MSLPPGPVCSIWYDWPQYTNSSSQLLVWYHWCCSFLVRLIPCRPTLCCLCFWPQIFNIFAVLRSSARLGTRTDTLHNVYHSFQQSTVKHWYQPSSLCGRYSAFHFLLSIILSNQHHSTTVSHRRSFYLDVSQSTHPQSFQDWILSDWKSPATGQT